MAFDKSKIMLKNSSLLIHFDLKPKTTVTCNASRNGIAAILFHIPDGQVRLV